MLEGRLGDPGEGAGTSAVEGAGEGGTDEDRGDGAELDGAPLDEGGGGGEELDEGAPDEAQPIDRSTTTVPAAARPMNRPRAELWLCTCFMFMVLEKWYSNRGAPRVFRPARSRLALRAEGLGWPFTDRVRPGRASAR